MIEVRPFQDIPTYYVRIDDDIYEMSTYADLPNGICIHIGFHGEVDKPSTMPLEKIPLGIVRQIMKIKHDQSLFNKGRI